MVDSPVPQAESGHPPLNIKAEYQRNKLLLPRSLHLEERCLTVKQNFTWIAQVYHTIKHTLPCEDCGDRANGTACGKKLLTTRLSSMFMRTISVGNI
ncbi:hypothetical protein MLD38_011176 [Melastoma candidum]|uniref:Uncharacterized protein n=1 Tax=Melastoma candidum TaxID=119954 RepID=A0ACB9R2A4_9MYRT|nr:hypothetical protein MLD38_011176 [Melastoma candidum]